MAHRRWPGAAATNAEGRQGTTLPPLDVLATPFAAYAAYQKG
ncbi:MAG TPA: hypothetical protein VNL77_02945 [Roseiflexaceae bacterium]|nr:hypothetical protein [Roseiflexaceae bacterium]